MKITVCIKQVPGTTRVDIDPVTGVLKRGGIPSKMNPYDLYALETALRLAKKHNGTVSVITMGPPQAGEILLEALYMGADNAVLISDRKFAGADVLATARTLSQAIKAAGPFDLILCGKQTTDGDTAQVGAETAEFLNIPHAAGVISAEADGKTITVKTAREHSFVTQRMPLPCLLCADADINTPRLPSYKRKTALKDAPIKVLSLADFEIKDENLYGLAGSPTRVERIFPPESDVKKEIISGTAEEISKKLAGVLAERKYI